MTHTGGRFARFSIILAALAMLLASSIWPATIARAAGPHTTLMDVVILVDESGSLSASDVQEEIKATATIALGGLNPQSRVSVYGFGSQNTAGQNAITVACEPMTLDNSTKQDALAACIK